VSPIARLRGVVEEWGADWLLVFVGGVGLRVQVPASTAEALGRRGEDVVLHTHLHLRDDAVALYGFASAEDLRLFEMLIGVSGVGPRGALSLLSALGAEGLSDAVAAGDVPRLQQVPGIGQKTAARLVLELKGKLAGRAALASVAVGRDDEVVAALVGLGYSQAEAQAAAASVPSDGSLSVEERIRQALVYFGRRA
jgi:Holliday junction DNA helicase RuvA